MTPFQASGAGQACEDAYALSSLLSFALPTSSSATLAREVALKRISHALQVYSTVRIPVAADIQERSRAVGRLVTLEEEKAFLREEGRTMKVEELRERIETISNWGRMNLAEEQVEKARALFEEAVRSL